MCCNTKCRCWYCPNEVVDTSMQTKYNHHHDLLWVWYLARYSNSANSAQSLFFASYKQKRFLLKVGATVLSFKKKKQPWGLKFNSSEEILMFLSPSPWLPEDKKCELTLLVLVWVNLLNSLNANIPTYSYAFMSGGKIRGKGLFFQMITLCPVESISRAAPTGLLHFVMELRPDRGIWPDDAPDRESLLIYPRPVPLSL